MDIVFVASVAVIAPGPAQSRKLYVDALGLPLAAAEGSEYWHSEQLAGTKSFGIWPLREAAQACRTARVAGAPIRAAGVDRIRGG